MRSMADNSFKKNLHCQEEARCKNRVHPIRPWVDLEIRQNYREERGVVVFTPYSVKHALLHFVVLLDLHMNAHYLSIDHQIMTGFI